jgi:hypothetical protein
VPALSRPAAVLSLLAVILSGLGLARAQLDGADRGIPPIDSTSNFEVLGIVVDIAAENADRARLEGWRRAQWLGWRKLWARTTRRAESQAPRLPENVLNAIVSGIVVEREQIGPQRYIARLGVLFDRARTGQMLGVEGLVRRSAPMLVIPVMITGATPYSFEFRNPWQRAWAYFRTANSVIDYVRPSGSGIDPLLLNFAQSRRRGRGWWRMILDQYGAAEILIAEVRLSRLYPGGPAHGTFVARAGPDAVELGRFQLRAEGSSPIAAMLEEGVRRMDALFTRALDLGLLRPDPSLVIIAPPPEIDEEETREEELAGESGGGTAATYLIQVDTPDAGAVQRAEVSVSRIDGVTSAITTSLALGGNSTVRVTFTGSAGSLQAALEAQGWRVQPLGGNRLRMSR